MTQYWKLWPYATVNFLYYAFIGGVISYIAVLLSENDFSSAEVGQLVAIFTLVRILTGQIWAYYSDKKQQPLLFFQLGLLIALGAVLCSILVTDKSILFISLVIALTAFMTVISQIEVLSLTAANDDPKIYNRVRLFGSIGFIIAAILMGWLVPIYGAKLCLYFGALCLLLILLFSSKLTNHHAVTLEKKTINASFWQRCFTLSFTVFVLASILLQVSFAPYISFFTQYLTVNQYQGIWVGVLFSLGTFAEIFMFAIAGTLLLKFNVKFLMLLCLLITAGRWYLQGSFVDYWWVMALTQCLHAFSFALMHSASIYFIKQHFPSHQQNRGQFMYLGVTFGIGGAIGAWLTGVTWAEGNGAYLTFNWAALCCFLAALLIFITPRRKFQFSAHSTQV